MILVGVDASRRDQTHEMASPPGLAQALDQAQQRRRLRDLTGSHSLVDARQVLQHHATGADIEVSHLGVPHLALRKAHVLAGCMQKRVWAGGPQLDKCRGARQTDGIRRC